MGPWLDKPWHDKIRLDKSVRYYRPPRAVLLDQYKCPSLEHECCIEPSPHTHSHLLIF